MLLSEVFIRGLIILNVLFLTSVGGFIANPDGQSVPTRPVLPSLADPPLHIASFNIQIFGHTKYSKLDVRNALVKVRTAWQY